MKRRVFLAGLGCSAITGPLPAWAQQAMPVIGMLNSGPAEGRSDQLDGFHAGLKEAGFVIGQNVAVVRRGADDQYERLPALATELVRYPATVIAIFGGPVAALAAKAATTTIPIVFAAVSDPVRNGLVASLNRPGGNVTGSAGLVAELDAKRLEILGEISDPAAPMGALLNANRPDVENQENDLRAAAKSIGRRLTVVRVGEVLALAPAFTSLAEQNIKALLVGADPFFNNNRRQVVLFAARHGMAVIYQWKQFPLDGGLLSYGPSLPEAYRLSGLYVGRILKGESPTNLPIIQPSKFELIVNLRTARALGLAIPPTLLARADEVID